MSISIITVHSGIGTMCVISGEDTLLIWRQPSQILKKTSLLARFFGACVAQGGSAASATGKAC